LLWDRNKRGLEAARIVNTDLSEQIDWYLDVLGARPASPATISTYASVLRRLERFCRSRACQRAEDLTPDLLRAAVAETLAEGSRKLARLGPARAHTKGNQGVARLMVTAARGLSVELRAKRRLHVDDFRTVDVPRMPERIQPRVDGYDFVELEHALSQRRRSSAYQRFVLARDAALVQFLFETGLRSSEASRLDVADLDLQRGTVLVRSGKGSKDRRLSIVDPEDELGDGGETMRRLRVYLEERSAWPRIGHGQRALWVGGRGARMCTDTLRSALQRLCDEAGLSSRPPHAFRRGWFTAAYRAEPRDLPILAARMGWSARSQQMVAVYTRGAILEFAAEPRPLISRACLIRQARDR
jgi:integrase